MIRRLTPYIIVILTFCIVPQLQFGKAMRYVSAAAKSDPGYPDDVAYGVNKFSKLTVQELPSGLTRFFLPGNTNVRRVQLSGSFNEWTTQQGLMTRTDSGWVSDIKLEPGIYAYKFIVNGRWTRDLENNLKEADGFGDYNSIYFRYNYTFRLPGNQSARRISVAGSFNNWNANELVMTFKNDHWEKQLYLHEGSHLYRFMIDGRWTVDPSNPTQAKYKSEAVSVLSLGETATFKLNGFTNAQNVYVAGSFNDWNPNSTRLKKTAKGWALSIILPKGNYEYKFIADGQWMTDPGNPHSSVTDDNHNSFMSVAPNHIFVLKGYNNAREVRLAGDMNNWNPTGYTLAHEGNEWHINMRLKPGKYRYKFVVDGQWILDPGNKQREQNEYGTGNSVLWIAN